MAIVYGPLWLVAPFSVRHLRFAQRGLLALIPVGAISMTYATDWGRVIFYAAPVLYVAAAYTIRHRRRLATFTIAALLALDIGYGVYMQVHGVRHGLDSTAPPARGPVY
jgi:hypothetical protein